MPSHSGLEISWSTSFTQHIADILNYDYEIRWLLGTRIHQINYFAFMLQIFCNFGSQFFCIIFAFFANVYLLHDFSRPKYKKNAKTHCVFAFFLHFLVFLLQKPSKLSYLHMFRVFVGLCCCAVSLQYWCIVFVLVVPTGLFWWSLQAFDQALATTALAAIMVQNFAHAVLNMQGSAACFAHIHTKQ